MIEGIWSSHWLYWGSTHVFVCYDWWEPQKPR